MRGFNIEDIALEILPAGINQIIIEHNGETFRLDGEVSSFIFGTGHCFLAWLGNIRKLLPDGSLVDIAADEQVKVMNIVIEHWDKDNDPIFFIDGKMYNDNPVIGRTKFYAGMVSQPKEISEAGAYIDIEYGGRTARFWGKMRGNGFMAVKSSMTWISDNPHSVASKVDAEAFIKAVNKEMFKIRKLKKMTIYYFGKKNSLVMFTDEKTIMKTEQGFEKEQDRYYKSHGIRTKNGRCPYCGGKDIALIDKKCRNCHAKL